MTVGTAAHGLGHNVHEGMTAIVERLRTRALTCSPKIGMPDAVRFTPIGSIVPGAARYNARQYDIIIVEDPCSVAMKGRGAIALQHITDKWLDFWRFTRP